MRFLSRTLFFACLLVLVQQIYAVPAFARRYQLTCANCHFGGTRRLNRFGEDFMLRGHRLKQDSTKTVDDIKLAYYLSLTSDNSFSGDSASQQTSFSSDLALFGGGPVSDGFSFFVNSSLSDGTLDEGYGFFNTNPTGDQYAYVRVGKLFPYLVRTSGGSLGLGESDPLVFGGDFGGGNPFTLEDANQGVSVGFVTGSRWMAEIGVTNTDVNTSNNNGKTVYGTVEKQFDKNGSGIGFLATSSTFPVTSDVSFQDDFSRYGPVMTLRTKSAILTGAYIAGTDKLSTGGHRSPNGYFAELGYNVRPDITPFLRVEDLNTDIEGRTTAVTLGAGYRLTPVGFLTLELSQSRTQGQTTQSFIVDFQWAF